MSTRNTKTNLSYEQWILNTASFYYQIFSMTYEPLFLEELLKGGGGNSTLCGSWMKLSSKFIKYRISKSALDQLTKLGIDFVLENDKVTIKSRTIDENKIRFYNNAKGISERTKVGKFFHFDHNPSNKHILALINEKVKELKPVSLSEAEKIGLLSKYIAQLQVIDLITIKQDDIRTKADKQKNPLSKDIRDSLLGNETFYSLFFN